MLTLYALCALTTAFTGIYELIMPVLNNEKIDWSTRPSKVLFYIVFFIMFLLCAPLVILSCLVPSWGIQFRESVLEVMLEET